MHTETRNQGQSNSLLKPKTHLEAHPEIEFTGELSVKVLPMDSFDFGGKNLLVMDVQGYELQVLLGGAKTLEQIDYLRYPTPLLMICWIHSLPLHNKFDHSTMSNYQPFHEKRLL